MKKLLFILLLSIILNSCMNMNQPEIQASYIQAYNSFNKEMVSHFPDKLSNNEIIFSVSFPISLIKFNKNAGLYLITKISSRDKYFRLKKKFSSKAKHIGLSTDNNYLLIKTGGELLNYKIIDSSYKNLYPIPQYAIYKEGNNNKWNIQKNSDVMILDCKLIDTYRGVKLKPKKNMPHEWTNGYSKGYTFNDSEQTIMYWLIIW